MPDIEFSTTGIQKILTNLNIKKAPGPDGITARYLKELAPIVAQCLQRIFSKCYLTGETPKDWRQANICPIFKKGERYKIRLFADDAIIYKTVKARSDVDILQKVFTSLEKWEKQWQMEFNPSKCHSISFTPLRNPVTHIYSLHQTRLEKLSSAKYLGVTLSAKLSWSVHVTSIVSKANRALGMIRRNINVAPLQAKSQAYQTLVRPHLEYCSSVWDPHTQTDVNRIEAVQRRATRF